MQGLAFEMEVEVVVEGDERRGRAGGAQAAPKRAFLFCQTDFDRMLLAVHGGQRQVARRFDRCEKRRQLKLEAFGLNFERISPPHPKRNGADFAVDPGVGLKLMLRDRMRRRDLQNDFLEILGPKNGFHGEKDDDGGSIIRWSENR